MIWSLDSLIIWYKPETKTAVLSELTIASTRCIHKVMFSQSESHNSEMSEFPLNYTHNMCPSVHVFRKRIGRFLLLPLDSLNYNLLSTAAKQLVIGPLYIWPCMLQMLLR